MPKFYDLKCPWMLYCEPEEEEGLLDKEEKKEVALFLAELENEEEPEEIELDEKW